VPKRVSHYEILEKLGDGAMRVVYTGFIERCDWIGR
jgi:hypothetical protein